MSTKHMLRALTLLCGLSPEFIAEQANLPLRRVHEGLYGWPLRPLQRKAVAALTKKTLRRAYAIGYRQLMQSAQLRADPAVHGYLADLDSAYRASFGVVLLEDTDTGADIEADDKNEGAR